jgi:ferric-dicitrate binding protein FerR (iron transport regulator)
MNQSIHRLSELSFKFLQEELTETESLELEHYLNESEENRIFFNELTDRARINDDLEQLHKIDSAAIWDAIVKANPELKRGTVLSLFRPTLKYAAAVILIAALGSYWILSRNKNKPVAKTETKQTIQNNDVAPGQYKAKLTLADGTTIILDSAKTGQLVQQGEINVLNKDGQLVYEKRGETNKVLYNTLSTSKAETYLTVLSDGTKVWLNSQSSIHYPVAFTGKERRVEITGEAYFEVAKDATKPFIVALNNMEVRVLGTHFNINAYSDDPQVKTTLLEGSVQITPLIGDHATVLQPGEQAQLSEKGKIKVVEDCDVEKETAWKNRLFIFKGDDVKKVMNMLSRWYDVEVVYEGSVPDLQFYGIVNMDQPASNVLKLLQMKGGHFKIENKKIIVTP